AELEDAPTLGRVFGRTVDVHPIDGTDEPYERTTDTSDERKVDVAEVRDPLRRVQLGRGYLLALPTEGDGRASGGAQVAHPLDVAPWGPDPAPAADPDNRHRRGTRPAAPPASDGDESVDAQRDASGQEEPADRVGE